MSKTSNQPTVKGLDLQHLRVSMIPFLLREASEAGMSQGVRVLMTK